MKIAIVMSGPNIVGRIYSDKLSDFCHTVFLDRTSKRALQAKNSLDPDYKSHLDLGNCVIFEEINELKLRLTEFDYAINGGGLGILKTDIIESPLAGWLNGHPGLLPEYRGLNPVQWAIRNMDRVGATVHLIDEGIDTGPILIRKIMPWKYFNSVKECHIQCYEHGGELLRIFFGNPELFTPVSQKKHEGNPYGLFMKGDF